MASLAADDATGACFFIASNDRLGAGSHFKNPLGVSPRALSRASRFCLEARKHRGDALSSKSSPHRKSRRAASPEHPAGRNLARVFFCKLQTAFVSRLGSSKSWLRQPFFVAYCKIYRKRLMRNLISVIGLKLHVYRSSFARATGPFTPTAATASCKGIGNIAREWP